MALGQRNISFIMDTIHFWMSNVDISNMLQTLINVNIANFPTIIKLTLVSVINVDNIGLSNDINVINIRYIPKTLNKQIRIASTVGQ